MPSDRAASPYRQRPPAVTPRLALLGAAAAAALAGGLIAYLVTADEPATLPVVVASPPAAWQAPAATTPALTTQAPAAAPAPPATTRSPPWLRPANDPTPSLSLAELQELRDTLAASSDAGDEFTRLTEQMLLADATRRFLQLRSSASPDVEELHGLVELIGPVLDAQLRRGELSRADALDLKSRLLQVQYPQASMQQGELTRWLAAQTGR